jgi:hypothetical protein
LSACASSFAGEVAPSTLKSLGLGGMRVVSDREGMQIRGQSSAAAASSLSAYGLFLYDPNTGSTGNFNGSSFGAASGENGGLNSASQADATSNTNQAFIGASITFNGVNYTAIVTGVSIGGKGWAFAF